MNANRVIFVAKKELDYQEKKSNSKLDTKHENAGFNNYTKYGKRRGCNGQPWCDGFVDDCFIEAYGEKAAKELLGGFSNYTPTSAQYFKNMKAWHTKNPKPGDVIFFKNEKRICHTGIVVEVDKKQVHTIEGNTSNKAGVVRDGGCVAMKSYNLNDPRIAGYGRPCYDSVSKITVKNTKETNDEKNIGSLIGKKVTVTAKNLNLRTKVPDGKIIAVLPYGKKVTIKALDNNWGKVSIYDKSGNVITGWICLNYVK